MSKGSAGAMAVLGWGLAAFGSILLIVGIRMARIADPMGRDLGMGPELAPFLINPGIAAMVIGALLSLPWLLRRDKKDKKGSSD